MSTPPLISAAPAFEHAGTIDLPPERNNSNATTAATAVETVLHDNILSSRSQSSKDEANILKNLTEGVRNQEDLERDITYQARLALTEKEDERDQKRIEKLKRFKTRLEDQVERHRRRRDAPGFHTITRGQIQAEIDSLNIQIAETANDVLDFEQRIETRHQENNQNGNQEGNQGGSRRLQHESHRDYLIRTGKITPFARMGARSEEVVEGDLAEALRDVEEEVEMAEIIQEEPDPQSHQNLRLPGFAEAARGINSSVEDEFSLRPRKKMRLENGSALSSAQVSEDEAQVLNTTSGAPSPSNSSIDTDYRALLDEEDEKAIGVETAAKRSAKRNKAAAEVDDLTGIDDGDEKMYQARLKSWVERRSRARLCKQGFDSNEAEGSDDEWFKPGPDAPDHFYENGLKLPGDIYPALFDYQKTGVQWLGELYSQQVGGIIGDEMGLGKTIQIISFLAGLHYSKKLTKPIIVVAPATVLRQWVNEFHRWWPAFRVSILHTSGSGMLNVKNEYTIGDDDDSYLYRIDRRNKSSKSSKAAKRIVDRVVQQGHVLVTTYAGLQTYSDLIIPVNWGYAVLDEGHKIRNPNTAITIHCKELRTSNRVILSGTPMQNNLIELWSLFDFVYPMRLGTLVNFRNHFEIPIKVGGYASATNLQILTATKCAETLKDAISPYLLQRVKADVAADLPKKSEQVLFCKLTKPQREAYEHFLSSDEMSSILNRTRQSLYGIDILRKICNHPDLLDPKTSYTGSLQMGQSEQIWQNAGC